MNISKFKIRNILTNSCKYSQDMDILECWGHIDDSRLSILKSNPLRWSFPWTVIVKQAFNLLVLLFISDVNIELHKKIR